MSDNTQQGGPGTGRGLPAPRSGDPAPGEELFADVLDDLRRLTRPSPAKPHEVTVTGILRQTEVEARPVVLEGEDGTTYELQLPADWSAHASLGDRVTVLGTLREDLATTTQIGPVLGVRSLTTVTAPGEDPAGDSSPEV